MPERLSRLLKAKLLRRSSTSAVPEAGDGADPGVDPNSDSLSIPFLARDDGLHRRLRHYSIASSLPAGLPRSTEDLVSPTAKTDGRAPRPACDRTDEEEEGPEEAPGARDDRRDPGTDKGKERKSSAPELRPKGAKALLSVPAADAAASVPRTPSADPAFPASSSTPSPLRSPSRQCDVSSAQPGSCRAQERVGNASPDSQLTPSLDPVAESPTSSNPSRPTSFPQHSTAGAPKRPSLVRRQSLLPASQQYLVNGLLSQNRGGQSDGSSHTTNSEMVHRKIWVKRPGASATLVSVAEDDLVDDLRDQVLRKYPNSLGKTYDAPDLIIRITPREGSNRQSNHERILNPEEPICSVIDTYYPGGQTVEEALIVDVPQRRTPKPSPRHYVYYHQAEPGEHGEYFPPMPVNANVATPPAHPSSSISSASGASAHPTPSISILTTGKAPPLPSPGGRGSRHARRPPFSRHPATSPTVMPPSSATKDANVSTNGQPAAPAPSMPTPPAPAPESPPSKSLTPPARGASPRPSRKSKKNNGSVSAGAAFGGLIEGTVPPINVLIVEDNVINQKLLEAFMKRLSVRWQCAPNGEVAVKKWRQGGFHLVLMDIQLPVMNGLEATKEIRRLERLNGIGVFSKTASGRSTAGSPGDKRGEVQGPLREEDMLGDLSLFKSPVIIVALTASSLQSDRHEALAAGCNDFLTKPVGFPWLEQKVTEWGCMQALIDFEGWRKWRGFADDSPSSSSNQASNQTADPNKRSNSIKRNNSLKKHGQHPPPSSQSSGAQAGNKVSSGEDGNEAVPPVPTRPTLPEAPGSSGSGSASGSGSGEMSDTSSLATCVRNGEPPGGSQDVD